MGAALLALWLVANTPHARALEMPWEKADPARAKSAVANPPAPEVPAKAANERVNWDGVAVPELREAANQGNASAQFTFGQLQYTGGGGLPMANKLAASGWHKMAADQGDEASVKALQKLKAR